jgi:hypothetical protein
MASEDSPTSASMANISFEPIEVVRAAPDSKELSSLVARAFWVNWKVFNEAKKANWSTKFNTTK